MNDSDLDGDLRDYYESIMPRDSVRATGLVDQAIRAKRKRRGNGMSTRLYKVLAVAAAGVVVVALFAVPILMHPAVGPGASSSPSAVATSSSAVASMSPAVTPSPSAGPTATQLLTTTPSPTLVGDWKVLASSDTVGASWSPDGKWVAVSDNVTNGPPDKQHLRLLDSAGDVVRALDGDDVIWLSATQFILSRGNTSFLGSVDSTVLTPTDAGSMVGGLSNDHGAVALTTIASDQAKTSFKIWTSGGTGSSIPGAAMAWSPDGTRLAVWHYTTPGHGVGGQPLGWLEVLSWPDLRSVAAVKNASFAWQQMSFDPTGRYLAATDGPNSILDVATGRMVGPAGVQMTPAWDGTGDLVVPASDMSGHVTFYPLSGGSPTTLAGVGDSAVSSTDGSTVVLYFSSNTDYRPITLIRNGVSRTIAVPGPVLYEPWLSADGSGVVVGCQVGTQLEALLLVG